MSINGLSTLNWTELTVRFLIRLMNKLENSPNNMNRISFISFLRNWVLKSLHIPGKVVYYREDSSIMQKWNGMSSPRTSTSKVSAATSPFDWIFNLLSFNFFRLILLEKVFSLWWHVDQNVHIRLIISLRGQKRQSIYFIDGREFIRTEPVTFLTIARLRSAVAVDRFHVSSAILSLFNAINLYR